jgi:phosphatidylserine decarboxylase
MYLVYLILGIGLLWVAGVLFLRRIWFYRDPQRAPESFHEGMILAPADGRVVYIRRIEGGSIYAEKLGERVPLPEIVGCDLAGNTQGWAIGIYMSPLDVHFNYCPYPGKVLFVHRTHTRVNLPMLDLWEYVRVVWLRRMVDMFARKYHLENERNTIMLDCNGIKMAIVLIADKFVSKIRCFVSEGQSLGYSEKIGFIDRGSQVDLIIFAENVEFKVGINDQVYGGKTAIAGLKN